LPKIKGQRFIDIHPAWSTIAYIVSTIYTHQKTPKRTSKTIYIPESAHKLNVLGNEFVKCINSTDRQSIHVLLQLGHGQTQGHPDPCLHKGGRVSFLGHGYLTVLKPFAGL